MIDVNVHRDTLDLVVLWVQIVGTVFTTVGVVGGILYSFFEYNRVRSEAEDRKKAQARRVIVEAVTDTQNIFVSVANHSPQVILDIDFVTPQDPDPSSTPTLPSTGTSGLASRFRPHIPKLVSEANVNMQFLRIRNPNIPMQNENNQIECWVRFTDADGTRWQKSSAGALEVLSEATP